MTAPKSVRIVLPVLIDGVSFPRKPIADHQTGLALVDLADDTTTERFQLAVRKKHARELEAALEANEDDEEAEYATGTLVLVYPAITDPDTAAGGFGVWLCAEKRLVTSRVGGPAEYDLPVAEEIARVLTEIGHDAEPKDLT